MQDQAPALCYRMRSTIEAFPALRRVLLFVVIALCASAVARAEYYPLRLGYEAVYRGTALGQPATITRMMPERAEVYGIPCLVEYTISESALGTFVWRAYLAYLAVLSLVGDGFAQPQTIPDPPTHLRPAMPGC